MTITLKPETEVCLREWAKRDNTDISEAANSLLLHVLGDDYAASAKAEIEASYRAMAADKEREAEALEWAEGTLRLPWLFFSVQAVLGQR